MTNDFFRMPFEQERYLCRGARREADCLNQDKIESELEHGIVSDKTRDGFVAIIREMQEHQGIEQIILGCTELPLLLSDETSPVPCLDTMQIHVAALIDAIVGKNY